MAKKKDDGQQTLRVLTAIDDTPGKGHKDPNGQVLLFESTKVLVPPGWSDVANMLNGRLQETEQQLKVSAEENRALGVTLKATAEENRELGSTLKASTEQNRRLANSLELIIPKFLDQSVNQSQPDLVFAHLADGETADVVIADGTSVLAEPLYTLATGQVAEKVGNEQMTPSRMAKILRDFKLFGDSKFHYTMSTSKKGICQKYKPAVVDEIYRRLANPSAYNLDRVLVAKASNFIRPKEVTS
jgi:hypothetical protein